MSSVTWRREVPVRHEVDVLIAGGGPAGVAAAVACARAGRNVLLAECNLNATFSGASSNGVITANSISDDTSANATGTAAYFRLYASDGTTCIAQGTAGTSSCDLNLDTTSIVSGATISISSLSLTHPRE